MNSLSIVMYHYVRDLKHTRYPGIKGLDIREFKEQIAYIDRHYQVVTMEEVIESLEYAKPLPKKALLLTFDDAYADHFDYVYPVLDKYKMQGSFYVPAKVIEEHTVLDVNKIHFILASVEDINVIIKELRRLLEKYRGDYGLKSFETYFEKLAVANRHDTKEVIFVKRLLQVELPEVLRNIIVNELFEHYTQLDEASFSRELYMDKEQLSHLLRQGMHIGNHGYDHYWWDRLDEVALTQELDRSLDFMEKLGVDMQRWTACYPYGGYKDETMEVLKQRGCKLAVTVEAEIADVSKEQRFNLPRLDTNDLPKNVDAKTNSWYEKG